MPQVWSLLSQHFTTRKAEAWAVAYGDDLSRAYTECWRGDWGLVLASGLGAPPALLIRAVLDAVGTVAQQIEGTEAAQRGCLELGHSLESGAPVPHGARSELSAGLAAEDSAVAALFKAALAVADAIDAHQGGHDSLAHCISALKAAATGLTFVEHGPRAHRRLAHAIRQRIPATG